MSVSGTFGYNVLKCYWYTPYKIHHDDKVAAELDPFETNTIITKVEWSDWATPTANIKKRDQSVRICGDYKVTVNLHVDLEQYLLPTDEDITTLAGGKQTGAVRHPPEVIQMRVPADTD